MPRDQRLYMTFPIDFHRHPKVARLSDAAFRAFVEANGESRIAESDGVIESDNAEFLWSKTALDELVSSHPSRPLMTRREDAYVIRDYADHQFTTADKERLAQISRENGAKGGRPRNPEKPAQVISEPRVTQSKPGIGGGIGKPSSYEEGEPPLFCSKHPTGSQGVSCAACGDARRLHLAWERAQKAKPPPVPTLPTYCTIHDGYPIPCDRCAREEQT